MTTPVRVKSFRNDLLLIGGLAAILVGAMVALWAVDSDGALVGDWASALYRQLFQI